MNDGSADRSAVCSSVVGLSADERSRFHAVLLEWYGKVTFYGAAYYDANCVDKIEKKNRLDKFFCVRAAHDEVHECFIQSLGSPSVDPIERMKWNCDWRRKNLDARTDKDSEATAKARAEVEYLDLVLADLIRRISGEAKDGDPLPNP